MPIFMHYDGVKGSVSDAGRSGGVPDEALRTVDAEASYEVKLDNVLVTSWQSGSHAAADASRDDGQIEISSFSWGVTQLGSAGGTYFDGRVLTAQDLGGEQTMPARDGAGETRLGDVAIVKSLEKATGDAGPYEAAAPGGVNVCFGDGSVRGISYGSGGDVWV